MVEVKVVTEKMIGAKDHLISRCKEANVLLDEISGLCDSIPQVIFASNIGTLLNEIKECIERSKESVLRLEKHTGKLEAIAAEYEITERRNVDESYSIDRS